MYGLDLLSPEAAHAIRMQDAVEREAVLRAWDAEVAAAGAERASAIVFSVANGVLRGAWPRYVTPAQAATLRSEVRKRFPAFRRSLPHVVADRASLRQALRERQERVQRQIDSLR